MPVQSGSMIYDNPPHGVDIYLPAAPTMDSGGGVKLAWSTVPDQANVPCSINTQGSGSSMRQGRSGMAKNCRIAFKSSVITVALVPGAKMVAVDSGKTFIITGIEAPDRGYGTGAQDIPALSYITADEYQ